MQDSFSYLAVLFIFIYKIEGIERQVKWHHKPERNHIFGSVYVAQVIFVLIPFLTTGAFFRSKN